MKKTATGIILATSLLGGGTIVADNAQNPYVDNGTQYTLAVASDVPQKERLEIAKDKPEITLKKWNDKLSVKIKPQFHATEKGSVKKANRPLLSKKMEFKKGNQTAFVAPKEDDPTAFDIDFTLAQKPASNVFLYQIEGAEELDFFYQPELTAEEKAQGAHRPDNVVGSYAVYHKTLKNHIEGQTNYATGKAFHIYRPKATDAKGKEVWAELSYASGTLAVTVPQDFLDKAKYPVVVDPTFGYTTASASVIYLGPTNVGGPFALSESGTLTSITAYVGTAGRGAISTKAILYNGSATEPDALVAVSSSANLQTAMDWRTFTCASESLSADDYWIGLAENSSSSNYEEWRYDSTSASDYRKTYSGNTYTTQQNPWPSASATSQTNRKLSIYATYTAGGGGGGAAPDDGLILFD